jgi:alpha-glucosidase
MKFPLILISFLLLFSCAKKSEVSVFSPDGKTEVQITVDDSSQIIYSVFIEDTVLIPPSRLGFQTEGEPVLGKNFEIINTEKTTVDQVWQPVYGERSEVKDHYNQLEIRFRETSPSQREFEMSFRVYNEGVAFNYTFLPQPGKNELTLEKELTEFRLNENYPAWVSDRAQSEYRKVSVSEIKQPAERPLVIEAGNRFLALGEARLINFSRMKFLAGERENSLVAELHDAPTV